MSSIPEVEDVVVPPAAAEDIVQGQVVDDVGQVEGEVGVVVQAVYDEQVVGEDVVEQVGEVVAQWLWA